MKVTTIEIAWHGKESVYSVDVQPQISNQPQRIATGGLDGNVRVSNYFYLTFIFHFLCSI